MSPIDWNSDIPIFITPIASHKKEQVFSLDDIFNTPPPLITDTPIETISSTDTPIETISSTDTPIETISSTDAPIETISSTDAPIETISSTDTPIESREQTEEEIYQNLKTVLLTIVESEDFIENKLRIEKYDKYYYEIYEIQPLMAQSNFLNIEKDNNSLILHYLGKSRSFSGTTLLKFIHTLARVWQVDNIKLQDASMVNYTFVLDNGDNIEISFLLYCFYILAYGESWYNTLGFYCDEYTLESNNNLLWINKEYDEFVDSMIHNFLGEFIIINSILTLAIDITDIRLFKKWYDDNICIHGKFYDKKQTSFRVFKDKIFEFFSIQDQIDEMSKEVFTDELHILNKDICATENDIIQIIIRQLFANLFIIVSSYHDEGISHRIQICNFFKIIYQIMKKNKTSIDKKYVLLLLHLEYILYIINFFMEYMILLNTYNSSKQLKFLYYNFHLSSKKYLVKQIS
jgi:HD-GYP domain-containing protein (c-di-GMP phosphodiesterase class II)